MRADSVLVMRRPPSAAVVLGHCRDGAPLPDRAAPTLPYPRARALRAPDTDSTGAPTQASDAPAVGHCASTLAVGVAAVDDALLDIADLRRGRVPKHVENPDAFFGSLDRRC